MSIVLERSRQSFKKRFGILKDNFINGFEWLRMDNPQAYELRLMLRDMERGLKQGKVAIVERRYWNDNGQQYTTGNLVFNLQDPGRRTRLENLASITRAALNNRTSPQQVFRVREQLYAE